ncbi:hypothetical protein niasHT_038552 [Heterodera trifolii]|uniref:RING-type domain-containing protein n=1 Tax=Heterodera trifolii TaxID=157864 RepID=A0ABD2HYM8_9BILA
MAERIFGSGNSSKQQQTESHALCIECLQCYTNETDEMVAFAKGGIGLKCLMENCENPISWHEIRQLMPDRIESIRALEKHCDDLCVAISASRCLGRGHSLPLEEFEESVKSESHAFCRECLQNYTETAPEMKPFARCWLGLKCMAEKCENPIPWQELKAVLPGKLETIQALENLCEELCVFAAKEFGVEEPEHFDENESHAFCIECLRKYSEAAHEEMPFARGGLGLKCMALNCENPLSWQEIKDRLPDQLDSIQTLENQCAEFCVLSVAGLCLVKCPNCNCAIGMETTDTENGTNSTNLKFQCPECQFEMCHKCKAKWDERHKDLTCEQFDKLKNYKDDPM